MRRWSISWAILLRRRDFGESVRQRENDLKRLSGESASNVDRSFDTVGDAVEFRGDSDAQIDTKASGKMIEVADHVCEFVGEILTFLNGTGETEVSPFDFLLEVGVLTDFANDRLQPLGS